jgi:L-ascorbate metabolism protein UlaG (beta-lactamase superfamily)
MTEVILICIVTVVTVIILFFILNPAFGGRPGKHTLDRMKKSKDYQDGKFHNRQDTPMYDKNISFWSVIRGFMSGTENGKPAEPVNVVPFDQQNFIGSSLGLSLVWFGHSTVMLNIKGYIILTDPVFSKRISPVKFMGTTSFPYSHDFNPDDLPEIGLVLISHDHYDHLDMQTIKKISHKVKSFYVPLGVAAHLFRWGVDPEKVVEVRWEGNYMVNNNTQLAITTARHFSGRSLADRNTTLWCSYIIKTDDYTIFYGADSGYGEHFKEIGEQFGPFDLTMLECGQYNKAWPFIHMMPEQTALAHLDLKGKMLLPIHWGKFKLSLHPWTEPMERLAKESINKDIRVITPEIGEVFPVHDHSTTKKWWRNTEVDQYQEASRIIM